MKGTTKPKGFEMAATVLIAALLIAAAFVPAYAAESPNSVNMDEAINHPFFIF
ncbi:MAG: hypothetical protein ACT6FF_06535 [Methanosarcinaceae archaeon]